MAHSRYIVLMFVMTLAFGFVWGVVVPAVLPARDANWIAAMYAAKEAAAARTQSSRLVVVSGSSGLFSLGAEDLERRLGRPVVNLSTHAGLGVKYLLYRARQILRPGDTALLAIEYELLRPEPRPSPTLTRFVTAKDFGYLTQVSWWHLPYFFAGHDYEGFIWSSIELLGLWTYKQSCYGSAKTLNAHGDETCANVDTFGRGREKMVLSQGPMKVEVFQPNKATRTIESFIAWAKENRVQATIGFPPLFRRVDYDQPAYRRYFDALLSWAESMGVPVLGRSEDFQYPLDHMFDTRYHLHSKGRDVHTDRVGEMLCHQVFECPAIAQ